MVVRLAFSNVTEAREPGDVSLLRPEAPAEWNDGVSPTNLREGTVEAHLGSQEKVAAVLAPDSVLLEIVQHARLATGATGAFIGLLPNHEIVCQATSGANAGKFVAYLNRDHRIVDSCIRAAALQRCHDPELSEELDTNVCRYLGARSVVIIPILDETNEKVGIFGVFSSQVDAFSSAHIIALRDLTRRIADPMAQADRGTPLSPVEASAPARSYPRKLAFFRSQLRFPQGPPTVTARRSSILIFGVFVVVLFGSWMLDRLINQRAKQTKEPSAVTSAAVYANPSFGKVGTNPVQSNRFEGSVERTPDVPTVPEPKKRPHSQQKLPDLEIENALDDESSESSAITKSSEEATAGEDSAKAAHTQSASVALIPEMVALDHVVERVKPEYPQDARAQQVQGTVTLDVLVGRDGAVESVSLVEGDGRFLAAAAEAVSKWRFTPLIRNGLPVSFRSHITLYFDWP
jgi:TonB family protein